MEGERVAVVTGGGRGIGLATARRLSADGLRLLVLEVREAAAAGARSWAAEAPARRAVAIASVTDREAVRRTLAECVAAWGRLDVVVNNAGINRPGGIADQEDGDWAAVLAVNLTGPFVVCGEALRHLRPGGAIVHVGSIGAAGFGASPAYAASKAGLAGLAKQMAHELGPRDITVNLVAPGVTRTEWVERNLGEAALARAGANSPLRRAGTPEDIAGIVAFLAGPDARHITGQVVSASGGAWMP